MIIDLTLPLYQGMPVYPCDPEVDFIPIETHNESGCSVHSIKIGTHAGTHIDAPYHMLADGTTVNSDTVLRACVGDAYVIDVTRSMSANEIIPSSLGDSLERIGKGDRALIATGWSDNFGRKNYYSDHPSISEELADILIARSIVLIGLDTPSLHTVKDELIHRKLLSAGIIIVENLINLKKLAGKKIFFSAVPLKLKGLDGSPVRAYAIVEE